MFEKLRFQMLHHEKMTALLLWENDRTAEDYNELELLQQRDIRTRIILRFFVI